MPIDDAETLTQLEFERARKYKGDFTPLVLAEFPKLYELGGGFDLADAFRELYLVSKRLSKSSPELLAAHHAIFGPGNNATNRKKTVAEKLHMDPRNVGDYIERGLQELSKALVTASRSYNRDELYVQIGATLVNRNFTDRDVASVHLIQCWEKPHAPLRPSVFKSIDSKPKSAEQIYLTDSEEQNRERFGSFRSSWTFDIDMSSLPKDDQVAYSIFFAGEPHSHSIVQNYFVNTEVMLSFFVVRDCISIHIYRIDKNLGRLPTPLYHGLA